MEIAYCNRRCGCQGFCRRLWLVGIGLLECVRDGAEACMSAPTLARNLELGSDEDGSALDFAIQSAYYSSLSDCALGPSPAPRVDNSRLKTWAEIIGK